MVKTTRLSPGAALAPELQPRLPGLLVMPLRAAEQHVLVVVGEADLATAEQLRGHLSDALAGQPPSLLVDLAGLDFCDLSGLDALHDATRQASAAGVSVTLRGMSPQLEWLHRTFPPRGPSPSVPLHTPVRASAAAADTGVATAPEIARPSHEDALSTPHATDPAPDPGPDRLSSPAYQHVVPVVEGDDQRRPADPANGACGYTAAYSAQRFAAAAEVLHAVLTSGTTRSGVCGTRVRRTSHAQWDIDHPTACPDCAGALGRTAPAGQPPA